MIEITDNIWNLYTDSKNIIVIPTNIGWKKNGDNVLGAGLAKDAVKMFPEIAKFYGQECKAEKENLGVHLMIGVRLLFFPVKSLNVKYPHLSWQSDASIERIEKSFISFDKFREKNEFPKSQNLNDYNFIFPVVGCGNGKLKTKDVLPVMKKYLEKYDNVSIVHKV